MRSVLITGAARRIGAVLAKALAADGWHVSLHCNNSIDDADATLAKIHQAGGAGVRVAADLSDANAAEGLVDAARAAGAPPLTALINNASLFDYDTAETADAASLDRHFAVNARAPILLSQAFARQLPDGETGCVVNLLDNKLFGLNPDYFSYTISKIALSGATEMLALALAPRVRVCGLAPSLVLVNEDEQDAAGFAETRGLTPMRRGPSPADVADAVRFILASPAYHGQTLVLDGGQSLRPLPRDPAFLAKED